MSETNESKTPYDPTKRVAFNRTTGEMMSIADATVSRPTERDASNVNPPVESVSEPHIQDPTFHARAIDVSGYEKYAQEQDKAKESPTIFGRIRKLFTR